MITFPHTRKEWLVAIVSALAGFFFGGAAVAAAQKYMRELLGVTS